MRHFAFPHSLPPTAAMLLQGLWTGSSLSRYDKTYTPPNALAHAHTALLCWALVPKLGFHVSTVVVCKVYLQLASLLSPCTGMHSRLLSELNSYTLFVQVWPQARRKDHG